MRVPADLDRGGHGFTFSPRRVADAGGGEGPLAGSKGCTNIRMMIQSSNISDLCTGWHEQLAWARILRIPRMKVNHPSEIGEMMRNV